MPGDQPGFLVADPLLPQRLAKQRNAHQSALQRHPLQDGAPRHPQPLRAVLAEVDEIQRLPSAPPLEDRRHEPEDLVPTVAHIDEPLQLGIDAPRVDLAAELHGFQRVHLDEVCPEPGLPLETLLQ